MDEAWKAGLEDVVAARSGVCTIDGAAGRLYYRGYEIGDLAGAVPFEDVTSLLWFGELPTPAEARTFRARLGEGRALPAPVVDLLRTLPRDEPSARRAAHGGVLRGIARCRRGGQRPRGESPEGVPPDDPDPGGGGGVASHPHRA